MSDTTSTRTVAHYDNSYCPTDGKKPGNPGNHHHEVGGGGGVFSTDDERRQAIIESLGIALADNFKSVSALTPAVLDAWRGYMNRTGTGPGAVVRSYWTADPPIWTPPGSSSSSRPALTDLTPAADAPAPGKPGFSATGAAMLAARLTKNNNGATPTN
jgi:hypothetical protein